MRVERKRIEITVEREQIWLSRARRTTTTGWCEKCGAEVPIALPETVAELIEIGAREIYRWVESGAVHFSEDANGRVLVCLPSVGLHARAVKAGASKITSPKA